MPIVAGKTKYYTKQLRDVNHDMLLARVVFAGDFYGPGDAKIWEGAPAVEFYDPTVPDHNMGLDSWGTLVGTFASETFLDIKGDLFIGRLLIPQEYFRSIKRFVRECTKTNEWGVKHGIHKRQDENDG